jgi:cytoskeleton protein RodZ
VSVRETETGQAQTGHAALASVGARLAEMRNKQQLSLESVAADLHLRLEVVQALESGDEASLPAAAFVRGYVKSYARLLGASEKDFIAELPEISAQQPVPLKTVGMRRRRVSVPVGKWLSWGVAFVAAALMISYGVPVLERLWSPATDEPASSQLELPQATSEQSAQALQLPVPDQPAAEVDDTVSESADAEEAVPEPAEVAGQRAEDKRDDVQDATVEAAGPAVVQMRFKENSWVEMEAQGHRLLAGMQRAGSERTVRAEPPIHLLLGNAPGVELVYRGVPVDLTPHLRGNVARLTLEE